MNKTIPYLDLPAQLRPLRKELDAVIAKTIDNCSFCLGPDVAQFEQDFARYCDVPGTRSVSIAEGTSVRCTSQCCC